MEGGLLLCANFRRSTMKNVGYALLIVGAALMVFGFLIGLETGSRGLRVMHLPSGLLGGVLFLAGSIFAALPTRPASIEAHDILRRPSQILDAQPSKLNLPAGKEQAIRHVLDQSGITRLFSTEDVDNSTDAFKIFLADHYKITRHEILGKYAFGERLFDDLPATLLAARDVYVAHTGLARKISESDWDLTRQSIESNEYVRAPDTVVVITDKDAASTLCLLSDGSFDVALNKSGNTITVGSLQEALRIRRKAGLYEGQDPDEARYFLEAHGYEVGETPDDTFTTSGVKTPEGATIEARGRFGFQKLLVQLAREASVVLARHDGTPRPPS